MKSGCKIGDQTADKTAKKTVEKRCDVHNTFFKFVSLSLCFIAALALCLVAFSDEASANRKYASIVMEANSGRVLHARNADKKLHPASLTKVMTLLLTFEALESGKLSKRERVYVSKRAASMVPSKLGLPRGSTIRVEDAVYALITKSANDVAVALAEHLGGTEWRFSRMMTEKAHLIGMRNTHFQNASGLYHPYQRSTARDIAILSRYVIMNYPNYYRYFSTSSFRYRGDTYRNHNRLMGRYKGMDGLKTGYIAASGFNLAASAVRGKTRLIGVVFGGRTTRSRDRHMAKILDTSFVRAQQVQIASADIPVPPEKPEFRKAAQLLVSASKVEKPEEIMELAAIAKAPAPERKPEGLAFSESSSFKLARFEAKDRSKPAPRDQATVKDLVDGAPQDAEAIPPEHFEMLAKVLGSDGFNRVIGQGDYDPTVLTRIETGLIAMSAHTGEDMLSVDNSTPIVNDNILSMGKRVFTRLFQTDDSRQKHLINGLPVPPMMPENRLWEEAKQNTWSVQIGAYNDRSRTNDVLVDAVKSLEKTLGSDMDHAKALVIPIRSGSQIVYRARLTRLERDTALDICRSLKDCMPIAP